MDEFERRLRQRLAARAQDVEPTAELWFEVEERSMTMRRQQWVLAAIATAAVVLLGVIVVPNVLDRRPQGSPQFVDSPPETVAPSVVPSPSSTVAPPVSTPTPIETSVATPSETGTSGPGGPPVIPDRYATTDGTSIVIHSEDGERTVFTRPEGESTVTSIAVRPAGDADGQTTIVFLEQAAGMWLLQYVVYDATTDTVEGPEQFPTQHDISDDARASDTSPVPVWSPDGLHLAWLEDTSAGASGGFEPVNRSLRAIGWSDGPGTGDLADDNAAWDVTFEFGGTYQLADWVWANGMDTETSGHLLIDATVCCDASPQYYALAIERLSDGGLAVPSGSAQMTEVAPADMILDMADSHQNDGAAVGPQYTLSLGEDPGPQEGFDLHLDWSADGDQNGGLPVPDELKQGADPSAFWMTARDDAVLLGRGGQAWLITRDSEIEQLPGTVQDAAFLPN